MAVATTNLVRVIRVDKEDLPDLNPDDSIDNVLRMYGTQRPELATAVAEGPTYEDGKEIYTANVRLGSKG